MAYGLLYGMASRDIVLCFFLAALLYSSFGQTMPKAEVQPEFLAFLENHTVTQGRDVSFTCVVNHLQSYKVAWIKSDSRAILAIHTRMVAHNPRLSVTHNGHNTWKLHVTNVQPNDSGTYMCQVNTDPMRSQTGHMKVVIPPDIMDLDDSADLLTATENSDLRLRCCATGTPKPMVTWRREDGRNITLRTERGNQQAKSYEGEHLNLTRILRQDMGSYLCIASNGVPPSVSKRYYVNVRFKPLIKVPNQLIAAPANTDVVLHCYLESPPKALSTWYTDDGTKLLPDEKHDLSEAPLNDYAYQLNLTIKRLNKNDFGMYTCSSETPFGKTEGTIRLQEMHFTKTTVEPAHRDNGWRKRGEKKGKVNSYVAEGARPGFTAKSSVNVGQTTPMSRRNSSNALADINPKKSKVSSYPAPAPEPAYFPPTQLDIQSGAESPFNSRLCYVALSLAVLVVVTCN